MSAKWQETGADNDNEAQGQAPHFALRIRNMACNALYKFFAIIEIVLQLFTDCPFCCQCLCALSTFCSLLFALFVVFRAQLAHHLRKSVRHLSATATFGFDLFAAFSCCSPSGSYSCCCYCTYFCCCLCLLFLVQNKLCHVKAKCCVCVCVGVLWEQLLIALVVWELPGERKFCRKFCTLSRRRGRQTVVENF